MTLKVFADRMSQPCRAVILFCKLNRIDFEEVKIDLFKRQHLSPEFAVITNWYQSRIYFLVRKMSAMNVKIDKFTGRNSFSLWQIKMRALLKQQGLWAPLSKKTIDAESAEMVVLEEKAHSTIMLCLADDIITEVAEEETASGLWLKLESLYMTKSLTNKLLLKQRLFGLRMQEEINPLKQVPAIVDGRFRLFESHAILIYLACAFPGVADHWYPADLSKRAKIHSVLDWHHLNLRYGAMTYVINTTLGPALGRPANPEAAEKAKKKLDSSLSTIESVWLKGSGKFLLGSYQPSIADLSLVCEIMQLEVLDEKDRATILSPYKKVQQWIEDTKTSTQPHFDDVNGILFRAKAKYQKQRENEKMKDISKATLHSKM